MGVVLSRSRNSTNTVRSPEVLSLAESPAANLKEGSVSVQSTVEAQNEDGLQLKLKLLSEMFPELSAETLSEVLEANSGDGVSLFVLQNCFSSLLQWIEQWRCFCRLLLRSTKIITKRDPQQVLEWTSRVMEAFEKFFLSSLHWSRR